MGLPASPSEIRHSRYDRRIRAATRPHSKIERLTTVDGLIAYDIPAAAVSGGGTRLASDVTEAEALLLARAMTYKLAVLELPVGGAKIGLRGSTATRAEVIESFRREIAPRLASGALMTGPDLGTFEADFAGLPTPGGAQGIAARPSDGTPIEELLTGCGVAAAITAALGGDVEGRTVALEGFGKMGASLARELARRGGRIVAVSTVSGCAIARAGTCFSLEQLLEARERWGDELVAHLGVEAQPPGALWAVRCDALVPGARPGVLDEHNAARVTARTVVPVANVPYTAAGLERLRAVGATAHADFVASAGGAMAYLSPSVSGARDVDGARAAIDEIMGPLVEETLEAPDGPYAGAAARAESFLRTWVAQSDLPTQRPLA